MPNDYNCPWDAFVSGAFGINTGLADLLQLLLYSTTYDTKSQLIHCELAG